MGKDDWTRIDSYFAERLMPADPVLDGALAAIAQAGMPAISVAANQGKMLGLMARMMGARRILEIGTLGAFSTIWLARALPPGGRVVTLEASPDHAAVAQANLQAAGLEAKVDLRVGPALDSLPVLLEQRAGPFDFVFIDADKPSNPDYYRWALQLTRPGSAIVFDNVVRQGRVIDQTAADDPKIAGIHHLADLLKGDTRVEATAIQTVGAKGHDGFILAVVQ